MNKFGQQISEHLMNLIAEGKLKEKDVEYDKYDERYSDINIIILTHKMKDDTKSTAHKIKTICDERKIDCDIIYAQDSHIEKKGRQYTIHNNGQEEGIKIHPQKTVAIIRKSITSGRAGLDILSQLEHLNIFCINYLDAVENCNDKYRTALKLRDNKIPHPKTILLKRNNLEDAVDKIGGQYPVVCKILTGSKGIGVFFIESEKSLKSTLQTMWKLKPEAEFIAQEFVKAEYDIRVHILGGEVLAAMKRKVIDGDFRSNFSLGGEIEKIEMTDDEKKIAIDAAKAVNCSWCGVDIIKDTEGKSYVLEVNSSAGTTGIEKASGVKVCEKVIDYCVDRSNWEKKPRECGYIETIKIKELGEMNMKMDSGNSVLPFINAKDIILDEKTKTVTWSFNDKRMLNKYQMRKLNIIDQDPEKREDKPCIYLDIEFAGDIYKDIPFLLMDRSRMQCPALADRDLMKVLNVSVNPSKKYVWGAPKEGEITH